MNNLSKQMLAEFLGVATFVTSIIGAITSGQPLPQAALATTLGLMILLTAGISGGHLNPAVSLYFFARKQIDINTFGAYLVAQLLGGVAGSLLGSWLWQKVALLPTTDNGATPVLVVSELIATLVLVRIVASLANSGRGALIPAAVGLWVFAAATYTPTGAQANPAVAVGLLFSWAGGHPLGTQLVLILAQLAGALFAVVLGNIFDAPVAKGKKK